VKHVHLEDAHSSRYCSS